MVNLERTINKKRGLVGYNLAAVKNKIHSMQNEHQNELERLQQKIISEKDRNQELRQDLEAIQERPKDSEIMEEVISCLKEQFMQQSKEILELKLEFEEKEKILAQQLEQKQIQKELIKKRVQDALEYLNNQKEQIVKELNK